MQTNIVLDFDSTFVKVESLDELARIALEGSPHARQREAEIKKLTDDGMEGRIGFAESLTRRLELFGARQEHIGKVVRLLKHQVTPSVLTHRQWIRENADRIYVISGGFKEYIEPVVTEFGISPEHVLANSFVFDNHGAVLGCDADNLLAQNGGKTKQVWALNFQGRVVAVGDGWSDYLTRVEHASDLFVAFTENVSRPAVVVRADMVARDFGEVIRLCNDTQKVLVPEAKD